MNLQPSIYFRTLNWFREIPKANFQSAMEVENRHKCLLCGILFKNKKTLRSHDRIVHLGIRNYPCTDCDKKFGKKSGLDKHRISVHEKTGVTGATVICETCGEEVDSSKYSRHMKFGHKENPKNKCHLCEKTFSSKLQKDFGNWIRSKSF